MEHKSRLGLVRPQRRYIAVIPVIWNHPAIVVRCCCDHCRICNIVATSSDAVRNLEHCNKEFLGKVGNSIGRTLKVDANIARTARGKFACLCVKLDLEKPLMSHYAINGVLKSIEYKGIHVVCFTCDKFDRSQGSCPMKTPKVQESEQAVVNGHEMVQALSEKEVESVVNQ